MLKTVLYPAKQRLVFQLCAGDVRYNRSVSDKTVGLPDGCPNGGAELLDISHILLHSLMIQWHLMLCNHIDVTLRNWQYGSFYFTLKKSFCLHFPQKIRECRRTAFPDFIKIAYKERCYIIPVASCCIVQTCACISRSILTCKISPHRLLRSSEAAVQPACSHWFSCAHGKIHPFRL